MAKEECEGERVEGDEAEEISMCQISKYVCVCVWGDSIGGGRVGTEERVAPARKLDFYALSYEEALQEFYR